MIVVYKEGVGIVRIDQHNPEAIKEVKQITVKVGEENKKFAEKTILALIEANAELEAKNKDLEAEVEALKADSEDK